MLERLGLADGAAGARFGPRPARSRHASGSRAVRPGNVQMFFPEANPLIAPGRRDPVALVPDYNATVEVVPAAAEFLDGASERA